MPIKRQVQIVRDQVKSTFGFKDVQIDPSQKPKEVRDQLSNFYQNAREMAHALGMPETAIGLDGKLTFTTKPYRQRNQALGTYLPGSRTIEIPGRSNSFAHEWTHALDHHLADVLARDPRAMRLLSMTKGVGETPARVGGRIVAPDTTAEAFVNVLRALYGKDAASAAEALKLQYELRGNDRAKALAAQGRLEQIESDFAKGARGQDGGVQYWGTPHEMPVRAHEAFVAAMIQRNEGDTRAVVRPYYDARDAGDKLARYYPQADERNRIFLAFTDLHDSIRRDAILGPDTALRPDGRDIVDPSAWGKVANVNADPSLTGRLRAEANKLNSSWQEFRGNLGFRENGADPGKRTVGVRALDSVRVATHSMRARMEMYVHRQGTPEARAALQRIVDKITPAEGLRSSLDAAGREVGPVFEQASRRQSLKDANQIEQIFSDHKLMHMTAGQELMLHHALTTGDALFRPGDGKPAVAVPANVVQAAGKLRYVLDQIWERNHAAGIDLGYAKSGFFPRIDDDYKIWRDRPGFERQVGRIYKGMFATDVGGDPSKLLAAQNRLPDDARAKLSPATLDGTEKLRTNLKEQDRLKTGIENGTSKDPAADQSRLDQLGDEARNLHDTHHDAVRDAFAADAARRWWLHKAVGAPTDFAHRGPNASYTSARVLPPEADELLRDYRLTDARSVLTSYAQKSARKVAFAERFGPDGAALDAAYKAAADAGASPEDVQAIKRIVEAATGHLKTGVAPDWEAALDKVHAMGTMALMGRAAFSSLTEPVSLLARDGKLRDVATTFARQLAGTWTQAGRDRAEISRLIGNTSGRFYDAMMAERTNATYRDSPQTGKWLSNFFRVSGLTQLNNSQRNAMIGTGHDMLTRFARNLLGGDTRLARDAAANFRDYGIADKDHKAFADWLTANPGIPKAADLDTKGGRMWADATISLIDKTIQNPLRTDKPELALDPTTRLAYGLMSFNYSWFHHIAEHFQETHIARAKEAYQDAREAGHGKVVAGAYVAPAVGRALGGASVFGAALVGGSYLSTMLRAYLTDQNLWQRHEKDGDLHDWLLDLAIARTGLNGPLDPVIQAITGLKYERDLSALTQGAQAGYFLQAATDAVKWVANMATGAEPNTNTVTHNGIRGLWNLVAVPALSVGLSSIPGGPFGAFRAAAGAALMYVSSRSTGESVADGFVGPKGTKAGGEPPAPHPRRKEAGPGNGVPIGLLDDAAAPAARVALPLWERLPRVGKIATAVGAVAYGASKLADEFGRYAAGGGKGE